MTLLIEEAYSDGMSAYRNGFSGTLTPSTSYGKDSTYGVRVGDLANVWAEIEAGHGWSSHTTDTVVLGMWLYVNAITVNASTILYFRDTSAGSNHLEVTMDLDGGLNFICGSGTFSTAASVIPIQEWVYVEIQLKVNATTGTIDCWVNGSSVLSETSKDTYGNGGTYVNWIQVAGNGGGFINDMFVDSWYLLNTAGSAPWNARLGVVRIYQDLPNGNGNSSGLTGSDGNSTDNYQQVDDLVTASEATYNGSATEGNKDTYAFGDIPSTPTSILGVVITALTEKTDVGAKFGRVVTRSNATDYPESSVALSQGYSIDRVLIENDPDTASAWTQSGYNAAEHGWEVRDS